MDNVRYYPFIEKLILKRVLYSYDGNWDHKFVETLFGNYLWLDGRKNNPELIDLVVNSCKNNEQLLKNKYKIRLNDKQKKNNEKINEKTEKMQNNDDI